MNGTYLKDLKLVEMRLKDLLQLYLEKALHKSKRPKILKYEVELMRRMPLARYTLVQLSPVKIAEFRDDRLKAGKSTSTVRSYMKAAITGACYLITPQVSGWLVNCRRYGDTTDLVLVFVKLFPHLL